MRDPQERFHFITQQDKDKIISDPLPVYDHGSETFSRFPSITGIKAGVLQTMWILLTTGTASGGGLHCSKGMVFTRVETYVSTGK